MTAPLRDRFLLPAGLVFLNHGSFGAVPRAVFEMQRAWQDHAEANPVRFGRIENPGTIAEARAAAAQFLGLQPHEVALQRNATEGISTVLQAMVVGGDLREGDEVLVSTAGYGSALMAANRWARSAGARVTVARVNLGADDDEVTDAFARAATPKTRLVIVDQITSSTASVLPVARVSAAVREVSPEVDVLVDAAHVPGHLDVRHRSAPVPWPTTTPIEELGASFWVGNLHKWALTARGCAVLWAAPQWRDRLQAPVTSWGDEAGFPSAFDRPGTWDQSAWLCLPQALENWERLGGWEMVARSAADSDEAESLLAQALNVQTALKPHRPAPLMRITPLPPGLVNNENDVYDVYGRLSSAGIEAQVVHLPEGGHVRVSMHAHTEPHEVGALARELLALA